MNGKALVRGKATGKAKAKEKAKASDEPRASAKATAKAKTNAKAVKKGKASLNGKAKAKGKPLAPKMVEEEEEKHARYIKLPYKKHNSVSIRIRNGKQIASVPLPIMCDCVAQ